MPSLRRVLAVMFTALALILGSGVVANASYSPPRGPTFNIPRPWGTTADHYRIVKTIEAAINHTRPNAKHPHPTIMVTSYLLDRAASVDALISACRRHVHVRVILDEDIENRNSRRLIKALNADNVKDLDGDGKADTKPTAGPCNRKLRTKKVSATDSERSMLSSPGQPDGSGDGTQDGKDDQLPYFPNQFRKPSMSIAAARASVVAPGHSEVSWGKDGSYVKRCDGSCRGAGGNMHSKFFLFSRTGKAKKVVMVSSSNLNRGGALLGWNDLFVLPNRPKSFKKFAAIHREMTRDTRAGDKKVEVDDGPYTARFFPMRHASRRTDPTMKDLNKIRCHSKLGRTEVHVSMFYWKGKRGNYILNKLFNLAHDGCKLSVIYGAPSRQIAGRLRAAAKDNVLDLYDSRWDFNEDGWNEVRTHAKYVLVKGTVGKDHEAYQVWTGSQNWVAGSLTKSDETTLNIATAPAYRQYLRNWVRIRNHSRQIPQPPK